MYKLSQDHLEIFFGSIRAHGGYNNNPTARQFRSACKKILVNAQIKDSDLWKWNCMALDDISILNCSSVKDPILAINNSNCILNRDIELDAEVLNIENDGFYLNFDNISQFSKEVSLYIAGFVSHKLGSKIKWEVCNGAWFSNKNYFFYSLINKKDNGLTYPSDDVVSICVGTEKYLKFCNVKKLNKTVIITNVLSTCNNNTIFDTISYHNDENGPLNNHIVLLIKSIIDTYCDIKINYFCRKQNENDSLRTWYNKLILFKGQWHFI